MRVILIISLLCLAFNLGAQNIRGNVKDVDSSSPLIGANIICETVEGNIYASTDENGVFTLADVPNGRVNLQVSYLGYEQKYIPNILLHSAKEVLLEIQLEESTELLNEVSVVAQKEKGKAMDAMALISSRSISSEETSRYAGGFNDPSRIVSNFAGVTNTQDGGNDIIIRGNSPKYIQWRLEGMQITNPNHFGDQSAVGGSISTLNNHIIDRSDFQTGAFNAEFGDVLSGVYDVRLRNGNNERFEGVAGVGLLGLDLTLEGPFSKNNGSSYLVNYRYSTAGLAGDLGLLGELTGVPSFQDAAFKVVVPSKKLGVFSLYGLGGKSKFLWEDVKPQIWVTPGSAFMQPEIVEDYEKNAHLLNVGLNHTIRLSDRSYFKSGIMVSDELIEDDIFEREYVLNEGVPDLSQLIEKRKNFINRLNKSSRRVSTTFHHKINARHKIVTGVKFASLAYRIDQSILNKSESSRSTLLDFDEKINSLRTFVNYKFRPNKAVTVVMGLHNMNVLYNNKSTLEPRVSVQWKAAPRFTIFSGYGNHSSMESIHNYFTTVNSDLGIETNPNKDLGLLKAHHYVLGAEKRISPNVRVTMELYYQSLYNLPVENSLQSSYSTINETLDFQYVDLVNEGTGRNYGIELSLERFFQDNFYFLANASIYESKYTALDGVERDTRFNGNYTFNVLFGKEFPKLGKKDNQTFGINCKAFYSGGKRVTPLMRNQDGSIAVVPEEERFYDFSKPYQYKLDDLYQLNVSFSYKWNKVKTTHELFLQLDNVTNYKGKISEYYDAEEPGEVGYLTQFGIFPNLMYRLYF